MIRTILTISLRRLWHNKPELLLTFVVPLVFFSIFAWIFGSDRRIDDNRVLKVVLCDEVNHDGSRKAIEALTRSDQLAVMTLVDQSLAGNKRPLETVSLSRAAAEELVRRGHVSAAIVLANQPSRSEQNDEPSHFHIQVMNDAFDRMGSQMIVPIVQKALASSMRREGWGASDRVAAVQLASYTPGTSSASVSGLGPPAIELVNVLGAGKANPVIAMYAAGIAVMFLLFSATTASGSLLDEKENSTLERILCSRATMDHLLMGKWCYLILIGCLQVLLMFAWGSLAFGLELAGHWDGLLVMTATTSGAAASFALMLAALCRSRAQLGWVSTIVILTMSALGGSMVPRYLMSDEIKRIGQYTFNAWALDGFNKIFWRELPIEHLASELAVLAASGLAFLVVARIAASRW